MLIEFSCKNYKSIRDLQTISFVATGLKSPTFENSNLDVDANNIVSTPDNSKVLKTVGIYGPNASGKSNLLSALKAFIDVASNTPTANSMLGKLYQPFKYASECVNGASFFQIVFMVDNIKYRYGFTVKKNNEFEDNTEIGHPEVHSAEIIGQEWLYATVKSNMVPLFKRDGLNIIQINKALGVNTYIKIPYKHSLLLSHLAGIVNNSYLNSVINYFHLIFITSRYNQEFFRSSFLRRVQENDSLKNLFLRYLKSFGLLYDDLIFVEDAEEMTKRYYPDSKILLAKKKTVDGTEQIYKLNLANDESDGTKKLFGMIGAIDFAFTTSAGAGLFIVDEVDSNFHPSLLIQLIEFFNYPILNSAGAQILFTSHDTNLLNPKIMRRDQFYFTEKCEDDSTKLYSLADLKGIRNDADFARQYLAGLYGSLPKLSEFVETEE